MFIQGILYKRETKLVNVRIEPVDQRNHSILIWSFMKKCSLLVIAKLSVYEASTKCSGSWFSASVFLFSRQLNRDPNIRCYQLPRIACCGISIEKLQFSVRDCQSTWNLWYCIECKARVNENNGQCLSSLSQLSGKLLFFVHCPASFNYDI